MKCAGNPYGFRMRPSVSPSIEPKFLRKNGRSTTSTIEPKLPQSCKSHSHHSSRSAKQNELFRIGCEIAIGEFEKERVMRYLEDSFGSQHIPLALIWSDGTSALLRCIRLPISLQPSQLGLWPDETRDNEFGLFPMAITGKRLTMLRN